MNEITASSSSASTMSTSLNPCIACHKMSRHYFICTTCKLILPCCTRECYIQPRVHTELTKHAQRCQELALTPHQRETYDQYSTTARQAAVINAGKPVPTTDSYTWYSMPPCRSCGVCDDDDDPDEPSQRDECKLCHAAYCTNKCKEEDKIRHQSNGEECVKRIEMNAPPKADTPSVKSSSLIQDLLAHAISFLSLYQWSQVALVNHAWRNATLQPSAFPNEQVQLAIDAPNIGLAHRECIRWTREWYHDHMPWWPSFATDDALRVQHRAYLRQYIHLRRFSYASFQPIDIVETLACLPANTLEELHIYVMVYDEPIEASILRFTHLRCLTIDFKRGGSLLQRFLSVLKEMTHLNHLELDLYEKDPQDRDAQFPKSEETKEEAMEIERKDLVALAAIMKTISGHLAALKILRVCSSYPQGMNLVMTQNLLTHTVTDLSITQHFSIQTTDADLQELQQLYRCTPSVTALKIHASVTKALIFDQGFREKRQLLVESLISCVDAFGPQLISLDFAIYIPYDPNGIEEIFEEIEVFSLDSKHFERMLAHCANLERLKFSNFGPEQLNEEKVAIMAKLTPRIKSLTIELRDSSTGSTFIESLSQSFIHLETLVLEVNASSPLLASSLAPPSPAFLTVRDSLPPIPFILLRGIDLETQVPSILRLLPRINTLRMVRTSIPPWRLFEYAQYRPLIFSEIPNVYSEPPAIPSFQTLNDESHLEWFVSSPELIKDVNVESALSFLPEHMHVHYRRGVELSTQEDSEDKESSADAFSNFTTSTLASHRWMFSRVRSWHWAYEISCPIPAVVKSASSDTAASSSSDPSEFMPLPAALVYHRSSSWTFVDRDHPMRNKAHEAIFKQLKRFLNEIQPALEELLLL